MEPFLKWLAEQLTKDVMEIAWSEFWKRHPKSKHLFPKKKHHSRKHRRF